MSEKETPHVQKQSELFETPVESISQIKKVVYLIARGRVIDATKPTEMKFFTIGTGCIVAPNRMITAAHVINDTTNADKLKHHLDGDKYYLIKCDDEGNWHYRFFMPKLDESLFIFPEVDLAIIYLEEEFYRNGAQVFLDKNDYIRIDHNFKKIGTEVAVLGYPLCSLDFINADLSKPQLGSVRLRVDTGVVNSRYQASVDKYLYEFTIAFNPGNSGGPIFDWRSGKLLSIVHGYRALPINMSERTLTDEMKKNIGVKQYSENAYIEDRKSVV